MRTPTDTEQRLIEQGDSARLRIGAFWFDVEVIPPYEGQGEFGHMNVGSQMIRVSADQRPENLANTFHLRDSLLQDE